MKLRRSLAFALRRLRATLAALLLPVAVMLPGTCPADQYPFSVVTEKHGHLYRAVAYNEGYWPLWVKASLTAGSNIASDRSWPVSAVVPPKSKRTLATLTAADPHQRLDFSYWVESYPGDPAAVHDPKALYRLPFADGLGFPISQAHGGRIFTHKTPESMHAVDFPMPEQTPIVAARDGTVVRIELRNHAGGKDLKMLPQANAVTILHDDGTFASYGHLASTAPLVTLGQRVKAGQQIAFSGNTGYSTGPHLHFAVQRSKMGPEGKPVWISEPVNFYVGNPPLVFAPRQYTLAKAIYAGPGALPSPLRVPPQVLAAQEDDFAAPKKPPRRVLPPGPPVRVVSAEALREPSSTDSPTARNVRVGRLEEEPDLLQIFLRPLLIPNHPGAKVVWLALSIVVVGTAVLVWCVFAALRLVRPPRPGFRHSGAAIP